MNRREKNEAVYYTCLVFIYYFASAYAATIYLNISLPMYFPLKNIWSMTPDASALSMKWYAMLGFAFASSSALAVIAWFITGRTFRSGRAMSEKACAIASMITWGGLTVIFIYVVQHEIIRWKIF